MPAIGSHSTATTDVAWDAAANRARLKNDGSKSYYRSMFAWVDPDGDQETKSAYKFPHHMVSGDGKVGAANTRAASAGIAVLNGGRGGADIPDSDRKGVYAHLAKHIRDAGKEPPELKDWEYDPATAELETHSMLMNESKDLVQYAGLFHLKEIDAQDGSFSGHAAVFGNIDLQNDRIRRGAFADSIAESGGRWPILMGHITSRIVGFSTGADEDAHGLYVTGEFTLDSDEGKNAYATARHAARLKQPLGLSIGYSIRDGGADLNSESGVRNLTALTVHEFSLAAVPANPRARIARVKGLESVRQVEGLLREAGFTGDEARLMISVCKGERDANLSTLERDAKGLTLGAITEDLRMFKTIHELEGIICRHS